jgi:hypothetical protein
MRRCFSVLGALSVSSSRVVLPAFVLFTGLAFLADPASAVIARAKDVITGDPAATLNWSEGTWSQSHNPIPGCVTFPGGLNTGPGNPNAADSVDCSALPDGWSWSVVVPGPFTLYYSFYGIPPGYVVCGQVFGIADLERVEAKVYLNRDWMICKDLDTDTIIWEGSFSKFQPGLIGGAFLAATRCGRVRTIAEGACCYPDGHCEYVEQARCPTGDWREGVPCDPNPCPPPLGACCYPDGHCEYVPESECPTGDWRMFVTCEPDNPCPPPQGACCYPDGHCEYVSHAECPTGDWREGVPCEPDNPCPPPVPTSETDWGQIKAHYR